MTIADNLECVRQSVADAAKRYGRDPAEIQLLAVSKRHSVKEIEEVAKAGQRAFGESYVSEAVPKVTALAHLELEWHFIGPIQSNKTKPIARHFDWVHSVDRFKIAERLSSQRPAELPPLQVCIEVKLSDETNKSGVTIAELPKLALAVSRLPRLQLRGLMTIPAPRAKFEEQRKPFNTLKQLVTELNSSGLKLDTLSMGMSNDYEAAIAEGSTIIRLGTAIFGPRIFES